MESFLENEIRKSRCFSVSAQNLNEKFNNKNIFIISKEDKLIHLSDEQIVDNNIFNKMIEDKKINVKEIDFLSNKNLLSLMDLGANEMIDDGAFRGIKFEKSGLTYKIYDYSPLDRVGILFREIDSKTLLVINFPKYNRVMWTTKGEYSNDNEGLKLCVEEYNNVKIKINMLDNKTIQDQ